MSRRNWLIAGVALPALAAGLALSFWLRQPGSAEPGAAERLLAAPLKDLHGQNQSLAQYRGKVLVVNFWATWCPPCQKEIPDFIAAQGKFGANGLQIVGIALDNPEQVAGFAHEFGINYPVLIGGIGEAETLRQFGNAGGGLPFTLIYDRNGRLREKILGGLERTRLEARIVPLI